MKITLEKKATLSLESGLLVIPAIAAGTDAKGKKSKTKQKNSSGPWAKFHSTSAAELRELDHGLGGALLGAITHYEYAPGSGKRLELSRSEKKNLTTFRISGLKTGCERPKGALLHEWRRLGGDAVQTAKRLRAKTLQVSLRSVSAAELPDVVAAVTEGLTLGSYSFTKFKGKKPADKNTDKKKLDFPSRVTLLLENPPSKSLRAALMSAEVRAEAVIFARDLVNTPPSSLLPKHLVDAARALSKTRGAGIKVQIFNRARLRALRAEALLGVAKGSEVEPFLIHLSYKPKRPRRVVTLIGKGITFDSGGLSIKTGKGMEDMKCDMSGAAAVISTMRAIARMPKDERPKDEVHVIVPTCENMINGESMKPGDVLRAMNGKTIEVLNTDAEGRLILADALCYSERIKSDITIDLATLTGACVVAIGGEYAGLFSADEELTATLLDIGGESGEPYWPLPLADEYRGQMESDIADLKNIGNGGPGATLGALFLREFVPATTRWAHLDIAGPAFTTSGNDIRRRGGSGFGVLTLLRLLARDVKEPK